MNNLATPLPPIKLIATGGTIAMKADTSGAAVPAMNGDELLSAVPDIAKLATLEVDNFSNIPSDYIGPDYWLSLYNRVTEALARDDISAVIIAHGTDTLEETAFFLELTLNSEKPIILVGAQRNASFPNSDGPVNLLDAVRVAVCRSAHSNGVLVVMNQKILAARDVVKIHTHDQAGFGAYDNRMVGAVERGYVHFNRAFRIEQLANPRKNIPLSPQVLKKQSLPRVDIIAMYAGAGGELIHSAVAAGAKGIVIQALGAGNVNQAMFAAIKDAISNDVAVVISTRVPHGGVAPVYGYEGGGQTLVKCGALLAGDLSPQKARVLLMLALQNSVSTPELQALLS